MIFCVRERFLSLMKNLMPKIISFDRDFQIFNRLYLCNQAESWKIIFFSLRNLQLRYTYMLNTRPVFQELDFQLSSWFYYYKLLLFVDEILQ